MSFLHDIVWRRERSDLTRLISETALTVPSSRNPSPMILTTIETICHGERKQIHPQSLNKDDMKLLRSFTVLHVLSPSHVVLSPQSIGTFVDGIHEIDGEDKDEIVSESVRSLEVLSAQSALQVIGQSSS